MKGKLSLCLPALALVFCTGMHAQQYLYTNDNLDPVFSKVNSVTALRVGNSDVVKIHTYSTGGPGTGTAFPGEPTIASARTSLSHCLFASNGGNSTIAAFVINMLDGSLTRVPGSPFAAGGSGSGDIGLAVGKNRLLFTATGSVSVLRIHSDCSLSPPLHQYEVLGPSGLKVTPNGKYLITSSLGPVDSFEINYPSAELIELGPFTSMNAPMGIEINCDSSTVYFGDAPFASIQIEVFSIGSDGRLTEINNFTDSRGEDSSSVVLSPDEKTLYVGNNISRQITALSTGPGGALSYGSTLSLKSFPGDLLGLVMGRNVSQLFALEQNDPERLAVLEVDGTTMTEIAHSPFPIRHDPFDPGSLTAVPLKRCKVVMSALQ